MQWLTYVRVRACVFAQILSELAPHDREPSELGAYIPQYERPALVTAQTYSLWRRTTSRFNLTDQSCCTPTELPEVVHRTTATKLRGLIQVTKEGCEQFEEIWKNRESHLRETPGFIRFALLRGDEDGKKLLACSKSPHVLPGNALCLSCRRVH